MIQTVTDKDRLIFDLRLPQAEYNESKKNALRHQISQKYGVPVGMVEVNFKPISLDEAGQRISLTADIIKNIQDPQFQKNLFKEYLSLHEITDVKFDDIADIDDRVNGYVNFDAYGKLRSYTIKRLAWSNYLSYGKDNSFDFSTLSGLVLLNGEPENQAGKTTFAIDLLRFALFGKAAKSPSLDAVFNKYRPQETEVVVEATLGIDGSDYVIRRTVTRPALNRRTAKSKCKQKVEYYKLVNGNYDLIENCEGESAADTNNIIRESVGTVDDFDLVVAATAYTLGDLFRLGQTDRGKLFSKWLGLVTLDEKEKYAKELWKNSVQPQLSSNRYNKTVLQQEVEAMNVVIDADEKESAEHEKRFNSLQAELKDLDSQRTQLIESKRTLDPMAFTDLATIEARISQAETQIANKKSQIEQLTNEYESVKDVVFNPDRLAELQKQSAELISKIAEIKATIMHDRAEVKRINDLIAEGVCHHCGHPVDANAKGLEIGVLKAKEATNMDLGIRTKALLDSIQSEITQVERDRENHAKKANTELRITAIKSQVERDQSDLDNLYKSKSDCLAREEQIRKNNEIDAQLRVNRETFNAKSAEKDNTLRDITRCRNEIMNLQRDAEKHQAMISRLEEEEVLIRAWNVYLELVGKNGIVKLALKRALPIINNEIGRLLNGLVDFEVSVSINEDGRVVMNLLRDNQILDLTYSASGYEETMSSLALRMALASLGNMGKPNFLVLDEVLSGVAVSNHDNIKELYRRISDGYDFIIHICHEASMEDIHDQVVTVTKKDGVSTIASRI